MGVVVAHEGGGAPDRRSREGTTAAHPPLVDAGDDPGDPPAAWPSIADYWPDAPHRIGPEADVYHLEDTTFPPAAPASAPPAAPSAAPLDAAPPVRETETEVRDPFEGLVLAEDFVHPPAEDDDLHWNGGTAAAPAPRRGGRVLATVTMAALLLAGLTALIVVQLPGDSTDQSTTAAPAGPAPDDAAPEAAGPDDAAPEDAGPGPETGAEPADADDGRTVSAPLDGRDEATFALLTDVTMLVVRTTSLDGELFRISSPEESGVRPNAVTEDGEVRLFLEASENEDATAEVEVLLSDEVRWSVRLLAGVDSGAVDLSAAPVSEVTLAGGATSIDLSLPAPDGTLPISLTKGANQLTVRTPARAPARVAIRQGAGTVEIDGASKNGIAKGEVFQSRDWQAATDRLDLDASAGLGTLRIHTDQ
ncbi:hypothetical protein J2S43_001993 [Catenuloplanes nepalensis]|uniref:Adhesin domain-containing protein n=1 Tax=Catenuloplanes nepalensis TaxID=587533 RepID=A0ABT9MPY6_9ACTN|nr:hypothetical protein [Catenuloplanes nepalensis]MDP9793481.1 hypothetical protein [Catenuloplanes nepalensis]